MALRYRDLRALLIFGVVCCLLLVFWPEKVRRFLTRTGGVHHSRSRQEGKRNPRPQLLPFHDELETDLPPDRTPASIRVGDIDIRLAPRTENDERSSPLQITEIFYDPDPEQRAVEFVELMNQGPETVALAGWSFTAGIRFSFSAAPVLEPNQCIVVCNDMPAFRSVFGKGIVLAGKFQGRLANEGERLRLENSNDGASIDVRYGTTDPWPAAHGREGLSLQRADLTRDPDDPAGWYLDIPSPGTRPSRPAIAKASLFQVSHRPRAPTSIDEVAINASVYFTPARQKMTLHLDIEGRRLSVPLVPSKEATAIPDRQEQPLEWSLSAILPSLPRTTLVRYWFTVNDAQGPPIRIPFRGRPTPNFAYYVCPAPLQPSLPTYHLIIAPHHLEQLESAAGSRRKVPATLTVEGRVYDHVEIRNRGSARRGGPKQSFKIFFRPDHRFHGHSKINLNSSWRNPALVREFLAFEVYRRCEAYSLHPQLVRLEINGQFWGVYTQIEQPDNAALERQDLKGATLYKASSGRNLADERDLLSAPVYKSHYEKETAKREPYTDLIAFCRDLNHTKDLESFFIANVDTARYVNYLCATVLVQNWDGFNKNHFIGHDQAQSPKWFVIPWNLDRTFGDHWDGALDSYRLSPFLGTEIHPGVTGWNRMVDRFLRVPKFRLQFLNRLHELLNQQFTETALYPILDDVEDQIARDADFDQQRWPKGPRNWRDGMRQIKDFIRHRRQFLLQEVGRYRHPQLP